MMFASSHTCNLSPERPSMVHMQFHQMVQGLMWQQMVLGWSFWARLFWRQSPLAQSNSQSYTLSLPAIISKKMQKKNGHNYEQRMREIEQGSFTPLVAPIHHWRNGSSCHSVLQEACLNDVPEAGLTIFKNHVLAEMLPHWIATRHCFGLQQFFCLHACVVDLRLLKILKPIIDVMLS